MTALATASSATEDHEPPRTLFGFDVLDFIGEGAGSVIYLASDPQTQQVYAIKHVEHRDDRFPCFIQQLENEWSVSRQLSHPGLRKSIDLRAKRTLLRKVTEAVLVMEMFDGMPLDATTGRDPAVLIDCFIQVAHALEALHSHGLIHCDLKPSNILVDADGRVKVIDFGQTCKAGTVKERVQGTPDFIAPEQVKCEPLSVRTDVFNLGATLYRTLAGSNIPTLYTLQRGDNSFLMDDRIASPHDLNPAVPEPLSHLVMECVHSSPTKRPASMAELASRLEIIGHGLASLRRTA